MVGSVMFGIVGAAGGPLGVVVGEAGLGETTGGPKVVTLVPGGGWPVATEVC